MLDFLSHTEAPFSDEQWDLIDEAVVRVARASLVARRFIEVYGPLGAGIQTTTHDIFAAPSGGQLDPLGERETQPVVAKARRHLQIPILYQDFTLYWRDIEASRQFNIPLDTSAAMGAAAVVARKEDDMIFNGASDLGYPGLLTVEGRARLTRNDWSQPGTAFQDVVAATETLLSSGFYGPYAMACSPRLYAQMHRIFGATGALEIEHVRQLLAGGVFQSAVIPDGTAAVLSIGSQNFDLAVSLDFQTAYLGAERMNHPFRVLECLALRIKRPGAICVLSSAEKK
jgi:uncharacterized linocin/CFP29 family protein